MCAKINEMYIYVIIKKVLKKSIRIKNILIKSFSNFPLIQGVIESCTDFLTTSYWLHVELGNNI
jgi:hypothetical protein